MPLSGTFWRFLYIGGPLRVAVSFVSIFLPLRGFRASSRGFRIPEGRFFADPHESMAVPIERGPFLGVSCNQRPALCGPFWCPLRFGNSHKYIQNPRIPKTVPERVVSVGRKSFGYAADICLHNSGGWYCCPKGHSHLHCRLRDLP